MAEAGVEKKKMKTGAKVAIGCGSGCLGIILLAVAAVVVGTLYVKKIVSKYEMELKGYGFEEVTSGQMLNITQPVTDPILFKAQSIRIMSDCSTNMAVLAQVCEIDGTIEGKLYFRGQVLTINPGAEVLGGIDAQAQLLQNKGLVHGGITGKFQLIEPTDPSAAAE